MGFWETSTGGGTSIVKNGQTFSEMHTLAVYGVEKVTEEMAEMHKKRNTFGSLARAFLLCRQGRGDPRHKMSAAKDVAFIKKCTFLEGASPIY